MSYTKLRVYKDNIVVYYSKKGKVFRYYTGVDLKGFDSKNYNNCEKQIKNQNIPKVLKDYTEVIIGHQERIEKNIRELINQSDDKEFPSPIELRKRLENPIITKNNLFLESLSNFISEKEQIFKERDSMSSLKDFISFRNSIEDYQFEKGVTLSVKDIDKDFLLKYKTFLIEKRPNDPRIKTKGNLGGRTIKKRLDVIKTFFKWMLKFNIDTYYYLKEVIESPDFDLQRITSPVKKFSLTKNQVNIISNLELTEDSPKRKSRDMFLVCCMLGLRFSDLVRIKRNMVYELTNGDKVLKGNALKTTKDFSVEIPDRIVSIFEHYNYDLNLMTNQKANFYLKELLKSIPEFQNQSTNYCRKDNIPYFLWELTTFHTGRRSFITILLNEEGFSTVEVMSRTDHRKISTIEKYVSPPENKLKSIRNVF
jgi:integrase